MIYGTFTIALRCILTGDIPAQSTTSLLSFFLTTLIHQSQM
jgi:hypothetical protein